MINTLNKTLNFLNKKEKIHGLVILLLISCMALLETLSVFSIMPFLAVLGNSEMLESNPILNYIFVRASFFGIHNTENFLILLGIMSFVILISSAVFRSFSQYFVNIFIETRRHTISLNLFAAYLRQPYEFFVNHHSGELSKSILAEVDQLIGIVIRPFFNMVANALVFLVMLTLLVILEPIVALLAVAALGGLYTCVFLLIKSKLLKIGSVRILCNKERFITASEALNGIKEVKLLGREKFYLNRFEVPSLKFSRTYSTHQTLNQVPNFIIEAIIFGMILLLTITLMLSYGGVKGDALGHLLPVLGVYAFSAFRMKPALQNIFVGISNLKSGKNLVDNLSHDLFNLSKSKNENFDNTVSLRAKKSVAFKNISFTYSGSNKLTIQDFNLKIPISSSVGIIGSTGSGKTTLVDILLGLLEPSEGAIEVDDKPVSPSQVRSWQQILGYVPQEIFLTDSTIAENIAMGIPNELINQCKVEECAAIASVHDFIVSELPKKYETVVGERGVRLSGGQRQRIGIARALYRNPDILVFDEATSALDNQTETEVMSSIENLLNKKTIIMIAHRLRTVKKCDQIVILEKGEIKAVGKYEELVKENLVKL
jgi:ATP-binding cassette, subfamily B, bacterial PglK